MNQLENYMVLKPISERLTEISKCITNDDLRYLIRSTIAKRIEESIDFTLLSEMIEDFMETNKDAINDMIMESLRRKL